MDSKIVTFPLTTLAINTTGSIALLNQTKEGTGFWNRVGNHVHFTKMKIKAYVQTTGNAINSTDSFRFLIVLDEQSQNTPGASDIIQDFDQNGTGSTFPFSGLNPNNLDRFTPIMDKLIVLPVTNGVPGPTAQDSFLIDEEINLDVDTMFTSGTNTAVTNSITLLTLGIHGAGIEGYNVNVIANFEFE